MTANELTDLTIEEITGDYQSGTLAWTKVNRPNEWGNMLTLEGRINRAALESDLSGLREVLGEYQRIIMAMVREFKVLKENKGQEMFKFVERPKSHWDGLEVGKAKEDSEYSAWSPTGTWFHIPAQFGALIFEQ